MSSRSSNHSSDFSPVDGDLDRESATSRARSQRSSRCPLPGHGGSGIPTGATSKLDNYSVRRRELLDILSSLHSTGIQQDLDLPQICVIGSQSVGKSSLIESMSGIKLPRDSGTCTRCPTEVRLQFSPSWSCTILLRFSVDASGKPLGSPHDIPFGPALAEDDKDKVEHLLRRAQLAILHPTMDPNQFLGEAEPITTDHIEQSFSQNCVCIRVTGPNVPDLYFYDLPGIIANVTEGGNEGDIKLVEDLAKSFINRSNCIILLVISCETDFENQGAGRLVLKGNSPRKRTVGVLTKVDRIEPGAEDKWISMLNNKENALPNGWFCVKQPDLAQLRSGISWEDAKAAERRFFLETPPWVSLDRSAHRRLGSSALAEKLGKILSDLVSQKLPEIEAEITQQLIAVNDELSKYPAPNLKDPKTEIIRMFRDFERELSKYMEGLPEILGSGQIMSGLAFEVNNIFEQFRHDIRRTSPQFRPYSSTDEQEIDDAAENSTADPSDGAEIWFLDQVMDLAKQCRTKELPGHYPFVVTQKLIARFLITWESLALACFHEIHQVISEHILDLATDYFRKQSLGGLQNAVRGVVTEKIHQRSQVTEVKVRSLYANERTPYTLNDHYFLDNRSKFLSEFKAIYRESCGHSQLLANLSPTDGRDWRWQTINDVVAGMAKLGLLGLQPMDLLRMLPEDGMTPGLEIMAEVKAYFKVACKRFTDNIPQQIDTDFLHDLDRDLGMALASMDITRQQCAAWLQEDPTVVAMREELLGKRKRLELAKQKIEAVVRTSKAC
ncbi:hypothetical protein FRB94_010067 [Tulasnella sp. JGI-2019a]|nr:hypothetical protein FRB94_010067 [Tulasnella sp. JGI-2019a]